MDQTPSQRRPRHRRIEADTWADLLRFKDQLEAWLTIPTAPRPDLTLLCGGHHSQFEHLRPGARGNYPIICLRSAQRMKRERRDFGERSLPPSAMLVIRMLLAFGGGFKVNSNGKAEADDDLSYLRMFGDESLQVLRVLLDAKAGEAVTHHPRSQDPEATFRDYEFQWADIVPYRVAAEALDKPMRKPLKGREEAIALALVHYDKHAHKPDRKGMAFLRITKAEYEASLRAAFKLLDLDRVRRTTH